MKYRIHATRRMFQRDIAEEDIELLIREGNIIESYDDDFPFPSLLINGKALSGKPLHVVVAVNRLEKILVVITAYEPDPLKWSKGFIRRIK